jgi:homoserine dehydrogenase
MVRIAIFGFGSVGQGVAEVLLRKKDELQTLIGDYRVVAVTDSSGSIVSDKGVNLAKAIERKKKGGFTGKRTVEVIESVDFDVAIEVTPTNVETGEPGLSHILKTIEKCANVITSNKGPLVVAFKKIMRLAEKKRVRVCYEATVGGAMPIIKLAKSDLAGNDIRVIRGVLNGTCNYILTRMEREKMTYSQVLSEAQELKIAEADPSYDVEGIDSAAKLVILANSVMGMDKTFDEVEVIGITGVTPEAFEVAANKNYTIRLIAEANKEKGFLKVSPRLLPRHHPLAIEGAMNAALIRTDLAGDVVVIGKGAGKYETASAVISDLIEIYRKR